MTQRSSVIRVSLIAESSRFRQGLSEGEQASSKFSATLKNLGAVAVAAIATKALGAIKDFAADSIRAFSELEQASGAVESVFGKSAARIDRWARSAASAIGLSEAQAKQSATVIGAFLQNYGFSVDQAADKSMELVNLGADLAAMFGGTVPDAVGALSAALRGEFNPIERYGVSLRVATIEAHALEMGLAKTKSEIDQNAKMLATLDLITKQTSSAHGQFARELDTVAGKEAVLNAELENSKALFGQSLAPAKNLFTGLQIWGVGVLTDLAQAFGEWTGQMSKAQSAAISLNQTLAKGVDPLEAVADAVSGQIKDWRVYADWLNAAADGSERSAVRVRETEAALRGLFSETQGLGISLEDLARQLEGMVYRGELARDEFEYITDQMQLWREETAQQEQDLTLLTGAMDRFTGAGKKAAGAVEELGEETEKTGDAIKEMTEASRTNTDALARAYETTTKLTDAEKAYNDAVKKFGPDSQEAIDAGMALLQVREDNQTAWGEFWNQFPAGFDAAFQHLVDSGMSPRTARAMIEQMQAQWDKMPLHVRIAVPSIHMAPTPSGGMTPRRDGVRYFAQGGVATRPTAGVFGEAGAEAVLPLESAQGLAAITSALTAAIDRAGIGGGGPSIQVTVNALDPEAAARAVVEALQAYERGFGAIPINVRP